MRSCARTLMLTGLATTLLLGCATDKAPGEWGELRYFGEVPGQVPMRLIPPIADRENNIYVAHGDRTRAEALAYIGRPDGTWIGGCDLHKDDQRGLHGWVGTDDNRAWYWSGDAMVELNGSTGGCRFFLDRDPASQANVRFAGVFPWIEDTPSATRATAIIHAGDSEALYHAKLELDYNRYSDLKQLEPVDATAMAVAGTGANPGREEVYLLLSYQVGDESAVELRTLDKNGDIKRAQKLDNLSSLDWDSVAGYLQGARGVVAGLINDSDILIATSDAARIMRAPLGMEPVGVHRWGDSLWLVGTVDGLPHLAPITEMGIGNPEQWVASELATDSVMGPIEVIDERDSLRYRLAWNGDGSAIGDYVFLGPHGPVRYTNGSALWLAAGPAFLNGVEGMTAVAVGAVAVSYP